jgi:hypothetical protein
MLGFLFFEQTSSVKRSHQEQIANYSPGERIPFIMVAPESQTPDGRLIFKDAQGGLLKTDLKAEVSDIGFLVILQGRMGKHRNFLVESIQPFSNGRLKFFLSILALTGLLWQLLRGSIFTPKGIRLISPGKNS